MIGYNFSTTFSIKLKQDCFPLRIQFREIMYKHQNKSNLGNTIFIRINYCHLSERQLKTNDNSRQLRLALQIERPPRAPNKSKNYNCECFPCSITRIAFINQDASMCRRKQDLFPAEDVPVARINFHSRQRRIFRPVQKFLYTSIKPILLSVFFCKTFFDKCSEKR